METVQRAALERFGVAIGPGGPIPARPFTTRVLDPGGDPTDEAIFYSRVNSHALAKLLDNTLTEEAMSILALRKEEYVFLDTISGN